jgi:hypothetical protein
MTKPSKLASELLECDYSVFYLGKFPVWLLSVFCLLCIRIRPKKTSKAKSKFTTFPRFITSVLYRVLGFKPAISLIFKKHNIDSYMVDSDSYVSFPTGNNIIDWHRDGGVIPEQSPELNKKMVVGKQVIKFFIYLDPNPFNQKTSLTLKNSDETNSGALTLVPGSSRFAKAADSAIANRFISTGPNTNLEDLMAALKNILAEMDRQNIQSYFGLDRKEYKNFIDTANNTLFLESGVSKFVKSFTVYPGKVILFDVNALHRGEATMDSKRLVLRFIASGQ